MRRMQLAAHLGEFFRIADQILGMVSDGTGVRHLVPDATETDAVARPVRHEITGLRGRNAGLVDLPGDIHFVQRLLDHALTIQLEHHVWIMAVVVAHPIGPFAGILVIRQVNPYGFQSLHRFSRQGKCGSPGIRTPGRHRYRTNRKRHPTTRDSASHGRIFP